MSRTYSLRRLSEILRVDVDSVSVNPSETYKFAGVYSFGRGLFYRGEMRGSETTYKKFHRLHENQFVMSQPKGWEGALARVSGNFDGLFLSPVYPTFSADENYLDIRYLELYFKQQHAWDTLERLSKGIGARRNSVYPEMLLSLEIPLPPLSEQRRIVEKIERVVGKIEEARVLRQSIDHDQQRMLLSFFWNIAGTAPRHPMSDVAPLTRRPVTIDPEKEYPQVAVRSFGRGTFHKPALSGSDVTWQKPFLVKAGDILISNIKAWEGAVAVAQKTDDERVGSHRYLTCVPIPEVATSRFVCFYLLTAEGLIKLGEASPGSADRNRTLNMKGLMQIEIPVPSYEEQFRFTRLCDQVSGLKSLQTRTAAELDALLPSILDRAFRGQL